MKLFKRYRAKVEAHIEVHRLEWWCGVPDEIRLQGVVKSGELKVGKTYLLIEEDD